MTQRNYEHLALMQLLDRVECLERTVETLVADNARLSRRLDQQERTNRATRRGRTVGAQT